MIIFKLKIISAKKEERKMLKNEVKIKKIKFIFAI